jgi:hypothetical protein
VCVLCLSTYIIYISVYINESAQNTYYNITNSILFTFDILTFDHIGFLSNKIFDACLRPVPDL